MSIASRSITESYKQGAHFLSRFTTFLFFTLFLVSLDHFKSPVVTVPRGFSSFTTSVHDRKAFSGVTNWQLGPYISGYRFIQCSSIQWLTNWMLLTFQFSNRKYEPLDIQYKHIYRNDTIELCTSTPILYPSYKTMLNFILTLTWTLN